MERQAMSSELKRIGWETVKLLYLSQDAHVWKTLAALVLSGVAILAGITLMVAPYRRISQRFRHTSRRVTVGILLLLSPVVIYFMVRNDYVRRSPPPDAFSVSKAHAISKAWNVLNSGYGIDLETNTASVARRDQWLVAFPSEKSSRRQPSYKEVVYIDANSGSAEQPPRPPIREA